ncbi:PhzF family phenazine biosynthesis protein [Actinoplanes tereljensis]|uniref:Oxidoreductase n=1 Tax=Paractinoplanes tereljensis TaxID=571912 RepID=A0A919NMK1_9ACTN|nr:PhzF family phenazine biosynthesis protein [Actinoplanes tereljensis]GIF21571.1 oxidoreductase [Actinoplanes tereljensis]
MRIRIIDAFTDRPFAGNPAGVCLLDADAWPDETWMRQVAAELNLSETAFAHPLAGGPDWALRWFTPTTEVNLCGHATLATAHALGAGTHRFDTRSGILTARVADDGLITLDFPAAPPVAATAPAGFVEAFGVTPQEIHRADQLGDLLAVLPDEAALRALRPDMRALAALRPATGLRGFIATAPGTTHDFVSRFFAPASGIPEDPVTGSAHTVLAPYWSNRLGRTDLVGLQVSARTGVVQTALRGNRVNLTGRAVTVLDGTLTAA